MLAAITKGRRSGGGERGKGGKGNGEGGDGGEGGGEGDVVPSDEQIAEEVQAALEASLILNPGIEVRNVDFGGNEDDDDDQVKLSLQCDNNNKDGVNLISRPISNSKRNNTTPSGNLAYKAKSNSVPDNPNNSNSNKLNNSNSHSTVTSPPISKLTSNPNNLPSPSIPSKHSTPTPTTTTASTTSPSPIPIPTNLTGAVEDENESEWILITPRDIAGYSDDDATLPSLYNQEPPQFGAKITINFGKGRKWSREVVWERKGG
jgi:cell division septation protein DedD